MPESPLTFPTLGAPVPSEHLMAELLEIAAAAARAAGAELMTRYGDVQGLESKSTATDPVSDADKAAEQLIVALISARRPDDGFIGEEGAATESASGITWVIDPLDGTVNYLYELDNFSVSVAAEDANGALVGAVYDPTRDVLYSAARGRGAYRGDERLRCAAAVPAARALLSTGFGYDAERRRTQGLLISRILPLVRDLRRIGSSALDLCNVASGAVNAYFEEGVHHWDVAAGALIAVEAGARVTSCTPTGVPRGVLAAAPDLHAELAGLLMAG